MLLLSIQKGKILCADQSTKDLLKKGHFGRAQGKSLELCPEEAMYLMDVRNASCLQGKQKLTFYQLALLSHDKKIMARYFAYKDWRDRGLIAKEFSSKYITPQKVPAKKYPSSKILLSKYKLKGTFFPFDLLCIVQDGEIAKQLYERLWFGQLGTYKAADRGQLAKFDAYETLYLIEKKVLQLSNFSKGKLINVAKKRRADFPILYAVYKDWRNHGYVVKTGFKFGAHFRIYFPGAKPVKDGNWVHSKHVLQVFPSASKLLISEWARAIRVAHSVRKTFILAIAGKSRSSKVKLDYLLYHRKGGETQLPGKFAPKYAMLALSEEEYIGGSELAGAIKEAEKKNLELILAIADRETAVTYYKVKKISISNDLHDYYEIDWMQP